MLTVEKLRAWGANVDEAMVRCMNNEAFLLRLTDKALRDPAFENLGKAVAEGDLTRAFECAHALKGTTANLALTPILKPVQEITELLRAKTAMDYTPFLEEIEARRSELLAE